MTLLGELYAALLLWRPLGGTVTAIVTLFAIASAGWRIIERSRKPWRER